MKKFDLQVTPIEWDADAIFQKSKLYFENMLQEESDSWQFGLYSTLALELLARSTLANVHPTLLVETTSNEWSSLSHAIGMPPRQGKFIPKSISSHEVFKRLKELVSTFDDDVHSFCVAHIARRNAELHSGATPFSVGENEQWIPKFYKACEALLSSGGHTLSDVIGQEESEVATETMKAANNQEAKDVLGDIAAHKKVWEKKDKAEQIKSALLATTWATKEDGHRVTCPACQSTSLVVGSPVTQPKKIIKDDIITETQSHLPSKFQCVACGLKMIGLAKLRAAGLGARYNSRVQYDATEYYASDDSETYYDFAPDNND